MTQEDPVLVAAAGRYPFKITDRIAVVVTTPVDGLVLVGYFLDGDLLWILEDPIGEA